MRKLGTYITAGWVQATAVVVGFALLALLLLPLTLLLGRLGLVVITLLTLFSGAALSLVTLRLGATQGFLVLGAATSVLLILDLLLLKGVEAALAYSLLQWVPLMLPALVLRYTVSLSMALKAAIALGLTVIVGAHLAVPDLTGFWSELLDEYLRQAMLHPEVSTQANTDDLAQVTETAAQYMTGSLVASMVLSMALVTLIARWWQSMLYNPGGFREEFLGLRLGYTQVLLGLALFLGAMLSRYPMMGEMAVVSLILFVLQGLAIVHQAIAKTKTPALWLGVFYTILLSSYLVSGNASSILFFSVLLAGICALGIIDTFIDLRAKMQDH
jgi:hypothetical protein